MEIQNTQTGKLLKVLNKNGFNAELFNVYDNDYHQDYNHLSIEVKDANNRLSDLWELCRGFEIILSKNAEENEPVLLVRKSRIFAELIKQDGIDYNRLSKREDTPTDKCTILTYQDWINFYKLKNH